MQTADEKNWRELKTAAISEGADLAGVADLTPFKAPDQNKLPPEFLAPFARAVSLAIRLDKTIIDGITHGPTADYARHYRDVNARLDQASGRLAEWIQGSGFAAAAIPASSIVDEENLLGPISHRAIARMAGIGWQGKSLLIVSPQFGPRIRLSTVLTNMPSLTNRPLKNRCGSCSTCATACPANAIINTTTSDHYATRDQALHLKHCAAYTMKFKKRPEIAASICGVCMAVCPYGR